MNSEKNVPNKNRRATLSIGKKITVYLEFVENDNINQNNLENEQKLSLDK